MLRLSARAGRVHVEVHPPEVDDATSAAEPASEFVPVTDQADTLRKRVDDLRTQAAPLAARLDERIAQSSRSGFYDNMPSARKILDEIYRLDGVLKRLDGLHREVRDQAEWVQRSRSSPRDLQSLRRKLQSLEQQADHVGFLVGCQDLKELTDAFVTLTRVRSQGEGLDGVGRLARMYCGLASLRGLDCEVIDDRSAGDEDSITLLISGAGAHALLSGETGLHQFNRGASRKSAEGKSKYDKPKPEKPRTEREVVRVSVLPAPADDSPFPADEVRIDVKALRGTAGRLIERPSLDVQVRHAPSQTTVRAWTALPKDQAREHLLLLLRARIQAATGDSQPLDVVRRYTLGPTPKVFDVRTNLSTARLEQVLKGHLDGLLTLRK